MCQAEIVLGEVVRRRRAQLGLSLREAARRIGIAPSYLVSLEQGRNPSTGRPAVPSPLILSSIARVLGVELWVLLDACGAPMPRSAHVLLFQVGRSHRSPAPAARRVCAGGIDRWIEVTDPRRKATETVRRDVLASTPGPLGVAVGTSSDYDSAGTLGAFADVLAALELDGGTRLGVIFGANSLLLRSVGDPSALLASEATWEDDVASRCEAALGVEPAANVCVYRDADLGAIADRLDRLEALISLIQTHPRVALEDRGGTVTTGVDAIEAILASARPSGVTERAWRSLTAAVAAAPQALTPRP